VLDYIYCNLCTYSTELFDDACFMDFQIICSTETLLSDICLDHSYPRLFICLPFWYDQ